MAQLSAWRSALANAVTAEDLAEVLAVLVRKAKAGERWAVRELLDRTLGRPRQPLDVTGIERGGIDESLRIARDLPLSANAAAAAEELAAAIVEAQRAAVGPAAQAAAGSDDG